MIRQYMAQYPLLHWIWIGAIAIISGVSFGLGLNLFLIPGDIYSSGLAGACQLIIYLLQEHWQLNPWLTTGSLYLILNIPIMYLGFRRLGYRFTILTVICVFLVSMMTAWIPVTHISDEPILNGMVGGVLTGIGSALPIKYGFSAGGLDIVSMVIHRWKGLNVGSINFMMNLLIVLGAGFLYGWEYGLFTLFSMFVCSVVIDTIHTNEQQLTVFVVTKQGDDVTRSIYQRVMRGVTAIESRGGYSKQKSQVLMVVVNRHELYELTLGIREADPAAFINVVQSTKVLGNYWSHQDQEKLRQSQKEPKS